MLAGHLHSSARQAHRVLANGPPLPPPNQMLHALGGTNGSTAMPCLLLQLVQSVAITSTIGILNTAGAA